MEDRLAALFPPFGLRIEAGPLVLRLIRDADLPALADLVRAPIFADPQCDYVFEWWARVQKEGPLASLQFHWSARAGIKPDSWVLRLGVFEGDRLIGSQDVSADRFAVLRAVHSGSYLRLDAQGRGLGVLMRQAMLVFAFDHLGATRAESRAIVGNERSLGVSEKVGYVPDGTGVVVHDGGRREVARVVVTPDTFRRPADPVTVSGVTPELLALLGADAEHAG